MTTVDAPSGPRATDAVNDDSGNFEQPVSEQVRSSLRPVDVRPVRARLQIRTSSPYRQPRANVFSGYEPDDVAIARAYALPSSNVCISQSAGAGCTFRNRASYPDASFSLPRASSTLAIVASIHL